MSDHTVRLVGSALAAIVCLASGAARSQAQPVAHDRHAADGRSCGTGDELKAILAAIASARGEDESPRSLGLAASAPQFGDLFVVEDDGSLTFFGITDSPRIMRRFYETWRDDFDFVAIYNDFGASPEFGFAYNETVLNTTTGLGFGQVDIAESRRFPTGRLLSYQNLNSLHLYPDQPREPLPGLFNSLLDSIEILAHEVGHQWMAKLRLGNGDLLGRNNVHWSFVFNVDASVMEGNSLRDNGDGSFTTVDALRTYSPLDQYLMGLRGRDEVPAQWVLENWSGLPEIADDSVFSKIGVTVTGTRRDFTIADIEAANGPRFPAAGEADCVLHMAIVLLVDEGAMPPPEATLAKISRIRLGYETFFRQETEGRGYLVTALCPPEAELRHRFTVGPAEGSLAGRAVAAGIDVTFDGVADVAVGAPVANGRAGAVVVRDGHSGGLLATVEGQDAGAELGSSVALLRDVDGVLGGEVVAGAPKALAGAGRVVVASARDGAVIYSIPGSSPGDAFGAALASLPDVNGDGRSDFAVSAPGANSGRGLVRVVSGADGGTIRTIPGTSDGERFGESLSAIADFDGDSTIDLLVGAPGYAPSGALPEAGRARVVSIATGAVLFTRDGIDAAGRLGAAVAVVPDVNGDGVRELLLGAPGASDGRGSAFLVSGDGAGALLLRVDGSGSADSLGAAVAGLTDVNGDGRGDLAIGAPGAKPAGRLGAGALLVFSGADGGLLSVVEGAAARDGVGAAIASHKTTLVVGAPREAGGGAARVIALESFHLFSLGFPKAGRDVTLEVWGTASERYAIVASSFVGEGLTPIPYPTGPGSASALGVGLDRRDLTRTVPGFRGTLDGAGRAAVTIRIPSRPELVGRTVGFQAVSLAAKGVPPPKVRRLSRPLELRIR